MAICLVVAVSLSTQHLLATAERLPFGARRDALVAGAEALDEQARAFYLDRPDRLVQRLTGRDQPGAPLVAATEEFDAPEPGGSTAIAGSATPARVAATATDRPTVEPPARPPVISTEPPGTAQSPGAAEPARPVEPAEEVEQGPIRAVTATDKLRLWTGGDSLGEYVGSLLQQTYSDPELTDVVVDYHISTGLARPDYFDWPAKMLAVVNQSPAPEALVYMVGGNDNQNMQVPEGVVTTGTPEWYAEYRRRVATMMDLTSDAGQFFWISLPPMRDPGFDETARGINAIVAEEAAARPWVSAVDITELFSGPDGGYSTNIDDPGGTQRVARASDGVHITMAGSEWVAERVWSKVTEQWQFPGDEPGSEPADTKPSNPAH